MTMPASKPCERARNATPGVVIMPALRVATPTEAKPWRNLSAIQRLETRVSCPITTRAFVFTRTRSWPRARPIQYTLSRVSGNSPATPRIPSVPKSCLVCIMREGLTAYRTALFFVIFLRFFLRIFLWLRLWLWFLLFFSCAFHDNRYAYRGGMNDLNQAIGYVYLRQKGSACHGATDVHGIRTTCLTRLAPSAG